MKAQFDVLKTNVRTLLNDLRASPVNGPPLEAAYNDYVTACQAVQQIADSTNAGVDLQCAGPSGPLSNADFFATIAPAIATMHTQVGAAQSALGAGTDTASLNTYLSALIAAYGKAGNAVIDPTAPVSAAPARQAFSSAANAIVPAAENLQKLTTDPAAASTVAATMGPLRAAVEAACAQLQSDATFTGVTIDLGCRP